MHVAKFFFWLIIFVSARNRHVVWYYACICMHARGHIDGAHLESKKEKTQHEVHEYKNYI